MFESEDFDLDEDFLEDIGKKEEEYYSQKTDLITESDPPAKRQKTESLDSDFFSDITFDDEPDFAKTIPKSVETSPKASAPEPDDVSSRKKRILEIFNTNSTSILSQNASQQAPKPLLSNPPSKNSPEFQLPSKNMESSRKALALEILKKGSLENNQNQKSLKTAASKSQNNREPFLLDKNSRTADSSSEIVRKVSESFKKPAERCSEASRKLAARNSPKFPSRNHTTSAPRMTLVRRFPGPAGLLPDNFESNLDHANFLNSLGEFGVDENLEESKISDYCSQNTERLFSSGAWRFMLDDLPANFLRGHEIATIKRLCKDSGGRSKVSFVAGVVQRIDQSVENPRLLLKDMTDSIEATMHSDIPLAHPNVLEPGVVILLRNAGLLGFFGAQKCPGPQYHLMISKNSVLAIYSEKKRLVSSPWMDSINKATRSFSADDDCNDLSTNSEGNERKILAERNAGLFEHMEISDFESEDDDKDFGFFNLGDITESQTSSFSKATKIPTKSTVAGNLGTRDANSGAGKSRADGNCKEAMKIGPEKSPGEDEDKDFGIFNLGDITDSQTSSGFSKATKSPVAGNLGTRDANSGAGKSPAERNAKEAMKIGPKKSPVEDEDKDFGIFNLGDITDSQTSSGFSKAAKSPVAGNLGTRNANSGAGKSPADRNSKEAMKIGPKKSPVEDEDKDFGIFNLGDITDSQTSSGFSKAAKSPVAGNLGRRDANSGAGKSGKSLEARKIGPRKSPGDKNGGKIEREKNEAKIEIKPKSIVGVRSRLLQFRSNDVLTPPISESKSAENSPSISAIVSNSSKENNKDGNALMGIFGDDLLASDEDTEDEMLSQLDVDSIMTNYNAGS